MHAALPEHWTLYILESDQAVRESICALVASNGWHYHAFSGARGFSRQKQIGNPACLLVDWDLPEMEPRAFLQHVRERRPRLPVVVMTARDDSASLARIGAEGPEAILPRPFTFSELAKAVARALGTSSTG